MSEEKESDRQPTVRHLWVNGLLSVVVLMAISYQAWEAHRLHHAWTELLDALSEGRAAEQEAFQASTHAIQDNMQSTRQLADALRQVQREQTAMRLRLEHCEAIANASSARPRANPSGSHASQPDHDGQDNPSQSSAAPRPDPDE